MMILILMIFDQTVLVQPICVLQFIVFVHGSSIFFTKYWLFKDLN